MATLAQFLATLRNDVRLAVVLPVKVISNEIGVAPQWSCTYEVSLRGARLKQVAGVSEAGQEIWIKRHNSKAKYRVIWIGKPGTADAGQFAVECLENTVIWEGDVASRLR
jgi:hypothetical protein